MDNNSQRQTAPLENTIGKTYGNHLTFGVFMLYNSLCADAQKESTMSYREKLDYLKTNHCPSCANPFNRVS
jgi:hypothetical protein